MKNFRTKNLYGPKSKGSDSFWRVDLYSATVEYFLLYIILCDPYTGSSKSSLDEIVNYSSDWAPSFLHHCQND